MPTRMRMQTRLLLRMLLQARRLLPLVLPPLLRHRERSSSQANVHRMLIAPRPAADSRVGSAPLPSSRRKEMVDAVLGTLSPTPTPLRAVLELEELVLELELELALEMPMPMPMPTATLMLKAHKPPPLPPRPEPSSSRELALQTLIAVPLAVDSTLESAPAQPWLRNATVDVASEMRSLMILPPRLFKVVAWDAGVSRTCKYM